MIFDYVRTNYFRNFSARTVMNTVSKLAGLVVTILLARYLGPAQLGYFSFVVSLAGTFSLVFALGFPGYVQKHISALLARGGNIAAKALVRTVYQILLLSAASAIFVASFSGILVRIFLHRSSASLLFFLAGVYSIVLIFFRVGESVLAALLRLRDAVLPSILRDLLRVILVAFSVFFFHHFLPVVLSYILAFGLYAYTMHLIIRGFCDDARLLPFRPLILSALPYLFFGLATMLLAYTDVLMLSALRPIEEVGYYKVAQLAVSTIISLIPVISVSLPTLSRAAERGELRRKFSLLLLFVALVSAVLIPILYFIGPPMIIYFFGPQYVRSASAFRVLLFLIPTYFVYALGVQAVISKGREWEQIVYPLLAGALNVVLNYYFILRFGMVGAAVATVLSMGVAAVLVGLRLLLLSF